MLFRTCDRLRARAFGLQRFPSIVLKGRFHHGSRHRCRPRVAKAVDERRPAGDSIGEFIGVDAGRFFFDHRLNQLATADKGPQAFLAGFEATDADAVGHGLPRLE